MSSDTASNAPRPLTLVSSTTTTNPGPNIPPPAEHLVNPKRYPAFHPLSDKYAHNEPPDLIEQFSDPAASRAFKGDEYLSIHSFPNYVGTSIERLRAHVRSTHKPPIGAIVSACILYGVSFFRDKPDVKLLIDVKRRLNLATNLSADSADEFYAWWKQFPFGVHDESGSRRANIRVTKEADEAIRSLSSELGVSLSALTTLTMCATLAAQEEAMIEGHVRAMYATVDAFLRKTYKRRRFAEVMLEVLD